MNFVWCKNFKSIFGITKGYLGTVNSKENYDYSFQLSFIFVVVLYNYFDKVAEGRINELKDETNDSSQPKLLMMYNKSTVIKYLLFI